MHRKLFALGVLVLSLSGCLTRLKPFHPGDKAADDEVVIVGRLVMEPFVTVYKAPTAIVGDTFGTVLLIFTEKPTDGFERFADGKFYANGPQGGVMAFVAPRAPLYLRGVYMLENVFGGGVTYYPPRRAEVLCTTNMTIDPQPEDRVIYVGAIYCYYERETPEAVVYDDWKNAEPELRSYIDTSQVKIRFPRLLPRARLPAPR